MLNLKRLRNELIYVENSPITVLDFTNGHAIINYQGKLLVLAREQLYEIDDLKIRYNRREGKVAVFSLSCPRPIYRGEIYESRRTKPCPSGKAR